MQVSLEWDDISRMFVCLVTEPSDVERVEETTDESKTGFPA
jgi:hypothetical protein